MLTAALPTWQKLLAGSAPLHPVQTLRVAGGVVDVMIVPPAAADSAASCAAADDTPDEDDDDD